jgi:hypothetical protein
MATQNVCLSFHHNDLERIRAYAKKTGRKFNALVLISVNKFIELEGDRN